MLKFGVVSEKIFHFKYITNDKLNQAECCCKTVVFGDEISFRQYGRRHGDNSNMKILSVSNNIRENEHLSLVDDKHTTSNLYGDNDIRRAHCIKDNVFHRFMQQAKVDRTH